MKHVFMLEFKTALMYLGKSRNGGYSIYSITHPDALRFKTHEEAKEYIMHKQKKVNPLLFDIVEMKIDQGM